MEDSSVGTWLKEVRVQKNLSVEQVSRDIYISVRLIQALEDEQYDEFVSEVYLIGFLKSYTDYLGLDSERIVQRFRSIRVQEQPTPMAELLKRESWPKKPILITLAIVIVGAALLLLIGRIFFPEYVSGIISRREQSSVEVNTVYAIDGDFLEREFRAGDVIDLSTGRYDYLLEVKKVARFVTIESPDERFRLENNERIILTIDQETKTQAELLVRQIIRDQEPPLVVMRVRMRTEDAAPREVVVLSGEQDKQQEADIIYGNTTVASRKRASIDLGQYDTAPTFSVRITFTASAFLQYQIDGAARVSRLYSNGDTIAFDPRKRLNVWATNAGAVVFQVANRFIPIGEAGEVASFTIEKNSDTLLRRDTLRVVPLY